MRILRAALVPAVMLLALAGCDSDSTGPDANAHVGTYTLVTVNGSPLPFVVVQVLNDKIEVTKGSVTLNADGTYSDRVTLRATEGGSTTTEEEASTGTYAMNGTSVSFIETSSGETYSGSLSGDDLTVIVEGFTAVYNK